MQVGHQLQFECIACGDAICFSVLDSDEGALQCSNCHKKYAFDQDIQRQLGHFEALCRQIHTSKEILGNTCVAVTIGDKEIKVPYKLLLTRLSSIMELEIAGKKVEIKFRLEPIKDVSELLSN